MPTFTRRTLALGLTALAVGASLVYSLLHQNSPKSTVSGSAARQEADLRTLGSGDAPWSQQSQALMRLSIQQRPEALDFIKKKLAARDEKLVPWATRALGYYTSPEAFELLRGQLRSDRPSVRQAALDALGMRAHPEKLKILEEAQGLIKTDIEHARLKMASLRLTSDPQMKSELARSIITELRKDGLEKSARTFLVSQIFFQSPRSPEVEGYFNQMAQKVGTIDESSAIATVRALKIYCPSNRFSIFRSALARPNLSVTSQAQILNELIFHSDGEANTLVSEARSRKLPNPSFLENLQRQIQNPKMKSPCASRNSSSTPKTMRRASAPRNS